MKADNSMSKKLMKCALYARVAKLERRQDTEVQMGELREYAIRRGMGYVEYFDHASGMKSDRPALNQLMKDAHARRFDCVIVWNIDRMSRSLSDLLRALDTLKSLGIDFISLTNQIHTSTPQGKLIFSLVGAFESA